MRNDDGFLLIVFSTKLKKDVQEANMWDPIEAVQATEANEANELLNEEVHRLEEDILKEISRNTALLQGIASAGKQDGAAHESSLTSPGIGSARDTNEEQFSQCEKTDNTQEKKLILLLRSQKKNIKAMRGELVALREKSQLVC